MITGQILIVIAILAVAYRKEIVSLIQKMKSGSKDDFPVLKWLKPILIGVLVIIGIVLLILVFKLVYFLMNWAIPGDFGEFLGFLAAIAADFAVGAAIFMAGTKYWDLPF